MKNNTKLLNNLTKKFNLKDMVKKSKVLNNNICVINKKIVNEADITYLNITQSKINEYRQHLLNGGTLNMTIEKFKSVEDKNSNILENRYVISITDIKQLGFRNKKQGVYRCRVIGNKQIVPKNIEKNTVLFTRPGGKGKFETQIDTMHNKLGLKKDKVDTVIDAFFGGGGYTLKHIEKLNFNNYIINDLDKYIMTTMTAIKLNANNVIKKYTEINTQYQALIPTELRNYKKKPGRQDKILSALRQKYYYIKEYYQDKISKLNNFDNYTIYEIAAYFIFVAQKTTCGFIKYNKDGSMNNVNFNHSYNLTDKTPMIIRWSYILNKYNVEIRNEDVFDLIKDKQISTNSSIYLDPPYINSKYTYNKDNSDCFQVKLLNETKKYSYRIYSNEDCEALYSLGVKEHFNNILTFPRGNKMGKTSHNNGGYEFLACNKKQIAVNNSNYKSQIAA